MAAGLLTRPCTRCVRCGRNADGYCHRCAITPYCSTECQRQDWRDRHRDICHNLARVLPGVVPNDQSDIQPAMPAVQPLRRPRSPAARREDDTSDRARPQNQGRQRNFKPKGGYGFHMRRPQTEANWNRAVQGQDEDDCDNKKEENKEHTHQDQNSSQAQRHRRPLKAKHNPEINSDPATQRPGSSHNSETVKKNVDLVKQNPEVVKKSVGPVKQNPEIVKQSVGPVKQNPEVVKQSADSEKQNPELVKQNTDPVKESVDPVKESAEPVKSAVKDEMPQITVADCTPIKKQIHPPLIPKNYLLELLNIGDEILLSVEVPASECRTKMTGYVCLSMAEKYGDDYQKLCDDYVVDCEADNMEYKPTPGESFSYFNPEDGGWYRARCLTPSLAALIDANKVVPLTPTDRCKKLMEAYGSLPEFCCVLDAESVKIGQSIKCILTSKTNDSYMVSMVDVTDQASLGSGIISRWLPEVEYPKPKVNAVVIPEVPRPPLRHKSAVRLVEASEADRVLVRPTEVAAQTRFDAIVQDVAVHGLSATPLKTPPTKGSIVIAKYIDDIHYRALVKRTNVKQNKYLLEYIEFGNTDISTLENLYPCPQEMTITAIPTEVSVVKIPLNHALTQDAQKYLEDLKDQDFVLTLPNSLETAPSGSEATLTCVKTNECVNTKLEQMCKPEWKRMEEREGDVIETKPVMFHDLKYTELPLNGCLIEVLNCELLKRGQGVLTGCEKGLKHKEYVDTTLRQRITEYCNSSIGKEPYLPVAEELCIAKDSQTGVWHRAVLLEQESGAGGSNVQVYYIDRGDIETLTVSSLRKMLPEFVVGLPAVALELEIKDFKEPTEAMTARAIAFLKKQEGCGLRVHKCVRTDQGIYTVEMPELIAAMNN